MGSIGDEKVHVGIVGGSKGRNEVSSRDVELAEAVRHLCTYYMAYDINKGVLDIEQLRNAMNDMVGVPEEIKDSTASEVVITFDKLSGELQREVIEHIAKESTAASGKDETAMKLSNMIQNVNFESWEEATEYIPGRRGRNFVTGPKEFGIGLLEKKRGRYKRHW